MVQIAIDSAFAFSKGTIMKPVSLALVALLGSFFAWNAAAASEALKAAKLGGSEQRIKRFQREAKAAANGGSPSFRSWHLTH